MARKRKGGGITELLQGFNQGYGLVNQISQDFELARIGREEAQQSEGFGDDDAALMQSITQAKDADGNQVYQTEMREDGSLGLKVRGADGSYTAVEGPGIQQKSVTSFLGKRLQGPVSEDQIDAMRTKAMANSYKRHGNLEESMRLSAAAKKLERDAKLDARDDERWGREQAEAARNDEALALEREVDEVYAKGMGLKNSTTLGYGAQGAGNRVVFANQGDAERYAEDEAFIQNRPVQATEAAAVDSVGGQRRIFTGLDAAVQAQRFDQSRPVQDYTKYRQIYDQLSQMPGGRKYADEVLSRMELARKEGTWNALVALENGKVDEAISIYNQVGESRIPDGARFVRTGTIKSPFDGEDAPSYALVDPQGKPLIQDIHTALMNRLITPEERWKQRQAIIAAERKGAAEINTTYAKRLATNQADINSGLKTPGGTGSGGASGSRAGKEPKPTGEVVNDLIKEGMNHDQDPNAITRARSIASTAVRLNPGLAPERLAMAAQEAVTDPTTVAPRLDMGAGQLVMAHTSREDGAVTPLYHPPAGYKPNKAEAAALRDDVRGYLREEDARQPGAATMLMQAAKGNKSAIEALRNNAEQRLAAQIITARTRPDMSAKEKLDLNAFANQEAKRLAPKAMASYQNAIKLIQQYGQ